MATQSVVVPLIDAAASLPTPSVGVRTGPSGSERDPTWLLRIVTMDGSVLENLSPDPPAGAAEVDTLTWTLNAPDECEFHFPKGAFDNTNLKVLGGSVSAHELQVFRNGAIVFWGPIVSIDASGQDGSIRCRASGVDWYLNRRFLDGTITNHIATPSFESGLGSWSTVNNSGTLTATQDTGTSKTGSDSAKLVNTTPGGDDYLSYSVTLGGNAIGLLITLSGWLLVDEIDAPALQTRGLYMEGRRGGVFQANNWQPIDNVSPGPVGKWAKMSTTLWIPPSITWDIEVRLYAPQATVRWDDIKLVAMDSLFCGTHTGLTLKPIDIAQSIQKMIAHLQSTTVGKSPLNLTVDAATTGIKLLKVYQFVDHVQFDQALREFVERDDGIDYCIDLTATTRTFKTFAGKRGTDWATNHSEDLVFDPSDLTTTNCADYRITADGSGCITRQVILGEDNGPDREQGEAADASDVGGVILQDVRQASQDATVGSLQPIADERIARYSSVPLTVEMDYVDLLDDDYFGFPWLGDLIFVTINDGYVQVAEPMRIMAIKLDAVKNMITFTVAKDTLT